MQPACHSFNKRSVSSFGVWDPSHSYKLQKCDRIFQLIKRPLHPDSILLLTSDLHSSKMTFLPLVALQIHCMPQGPEMKQATYFTSHSGTCLLTCISSVLCGKIFLFTRHSWGSSWHHSQKAKTKPTKSLIYCVVLEAIWNFISHGNN